MKIEDILKEIMICIEHNDKIDYYLDNEDLQALLEYIAYLQRKEYNNSKAIEYVKEHTNNFVEYLDVYETKELSNILEKGE